VHSLRDLWYSEWPVSLCPVLIVTSLLFTKTLVGKSVATQRREQLNDEACLNWH
jgi:hypothetical protein